MGERERRVMREVLREILPDKDRLFRINSGMGWIGEMVRHSDGIVILKNARPLHAAPEGWPDLFGWTVVEVTPEMVGRKIAVARGVEVKAGNDKMRASQEKFKKLLESMGGIYEVVSDS